MTKLISICLLALISVAALSGCATIVPSNVDYSFSAQAERVVTRAMKVSGCPYGVRDSSIVTISDMQVSRSDSTRQGVNVRSTEVVGGNRRTTCNPDPAGQKK